MTKAVNSEPIYYDKRQDRYTRWGAVIGAVAGAALGFSLAGWVGFGLGFTTVPIIGGIMGYLTWVEMPEGTRLLWLPAAFIIATGRAVKFLMRRALISED